MAAASRARAPFSSFVLVALVASLLQLWSGSSLAAPTAGSLSANPAQVVVPGQRVSLNGSLPRGGRTVALQGRVDDGSWGTLATKKSRTNGTFTFRPRVPLAADDNVSYRVFARAIGSFPAVETPQVTLEVVTPVSSLHAPTRVRLNTGYEVLALFYPAHPGRSVVLQRRSGTRWVKVASRNQNSSGAATFPRTASAVGTTTFRAVAATYDAAPQVVTGTQVVRVVSSGDVTPPPVPSELSGYVGAQGAELDWDAASATDLAGYHLYRGQTATGPWTRLTTSSVPTTSFTDSQTEDPTDHWYVVTSVDELGNESARSAAVQPDPEPPADTTAPPVPSGLNATAGDGQVELDWDAVTAPDLAGYRVHYTTDPTGTWTEFGTLGSSTTRTVTGLTNATQYHFAVTAVDTTGNQSDRSTPVSATPADTTAPATPTGLNATAGAARVFLEWDPVADADVVGYLVLRAETEGGPYGVITPSPVTDTDYEDTGLHNGTTYWYAVKAVDEADNASGPSASASATPDGPDPVVGHKIAAGTRASCEVRSNGTAWCWGDNVNRQLGQGPMSHGGPEPQQIGSAGDWQSISVGFYQVCGLRTPGTAWCWGSGAPVGTNGTPTQLGTATDWTAISVGGGPGLPGGWHACGTRSDGTAWCWGRNSEGQLGNGSTTDNISTPIQVVGDNWLSVESGRVHTCGVKRDGTAWCWGHNADGQLGDSTATGRASPTQVGLSEDWVSISAGSTSTCGVREDGTLWCWGNFGPTGGVGQTTTPRQVGAEVDWLRVDVGPQHACGLRTGDRAMCWGSNARGAFGDGGTSSSAMPRSVTGTGWTEVVAGDSHTCGVKSAGALCWGDYDRGQVGGSRTNLGPAPVALHGGLTWTDVVPGSTHACGLRGAGTLWCWGSSSQGQVGNGSALQQVYTDPVQVGSATDWSELSLSGHTCGLRAEGTLWCWGTNQLGQVGDGTTAPRYAPTQVGGNDWATLGDVNQASHTCAIRTNGTLWCWGSNFFGQLGDGTKTNRSSPVQVGSASDWVTVAQGSRATCGTRSDGSAWCWGDNQYGQLGDGTTTTSLTPTRVGTGTDWTTVMPGDRHTCGLKADRSAWCWGSDGWSQLGTVSSADLVNPDPLQVRPATATWSSLDLAQTHTCGIRTDGTAWCWGQDINDGKLGDGQPITNGPVQVGAADDWAAIHAGHNDTVGLRSGGTAWWWGTNDGGENGRAFFDSTPSPVG